MTAATDAPPDSVVRRAHDGAPPGPGRARVVVLEADARLTAKDFGSLDEALAYADDAASEPDGPLAAVFDDALRFVRRGRHY